MQRAQWLWRSSWPLLLAALLPTWGDAAPPVAAGAQSLGVEGTAFVLHQTDGTTLRGIQLQGMVLQLPVGDQVRAVQLASIRPDPDDGDILQHEFRIQDQAGRWQSACMPAYDGETWGIPLAAPATAVAPVLITCASGAVAKCIRYGYKPWGRGRNGEDLAPYHAACVRMIRADFAGDGTPHTKAGTFIRYHDDAVNIQRGAHEDQDPEYAFEAGWSAEGAACIAQVRWPEFGSIDTLIAASPRLAQTPPAKCNERTARDGGALIFSASLRKPRLGP